MSPTPRIHSFSSIEYNWNTTEQVNIVQRIFILCFAINSIISEISQLLKINNQKVEQILKEAKKERLRIKTI